MKGPEAAKRPGPQVKTNAVAMKGVNDDEFSDMIAWCGDARGSPLSFDLPCVRIDAPISTRNSIRPARH